MEIVSFFYCLGATFNSIYKPCFSVLFAYRRTEVVDIHIVFKLVISLGRNGYKPRAFVSGAGVEFALNIGEGLFFISFFHNKSPFPLADSRGREAPAILFNHLFNHGLGKDGIAFCRVVYEYMSESSDELAVLYNRRA